MFEKHTFEIYSEAKLTASCKVHGMRDGVVSVDAEGHQHVGRRIRHDNLVGQNLEDECVAILCKNKDLVVSNKSYALDNFKVILKQTTT